MDKKVKKELKFIDGYSESAWKSLVVKSLRMGWVDGLNEAATHLNKSTMKSLLLCGLFEDVFPVGWHELNMCIKEIEAQRYDLLCMRETHHGRGYTEQFCDMADEAVKNGEKEFYKMMNTVQAYSYLKWLSPRVGNCLYTWLKIIPQRSQTRQICHKEWTGMPLCILDAHTFEGRVLKQKITLLSGHYENHRILGQRVMREGWFDIRVEALSDIHERKDLKSELTLF